VHGYTGIAGLRACRRSNPDPAIQDDAMNDNTGYAVFFFPPALEALGEAVKPYLREGPMGPHIPCREVDTGGSFVELTLDDQAAEGGHVAVELMVPSSMVRMIVSARSDNEFGFHVRVKPSVLEPGMVAPAAGEAQSSAPADAAARDASKPPDG
jgi:hypothetical protein